MSILIDRERCLACGICEEQCILDNIRVQTPPCRQACPLAINPQAYSALAAMDRLDLAMRMIWEATPFPAILGYVCHAPCEEACTRRLVDESVSIRRLKRYVVERAGGEGYPARAGEPTDKRVAVIGAGPAGATASVRLREMGHGVSLYDSQDGPGGMVVSSIPRFHLDLEVVRQELRVLDRLGVEQRYGEQVGRDVELEEIRSAHDAVLLAVGTHVGERLELEGADAPGVYEGLELIKAAHTGERLELGDRVVVLGGGNVAVDSARVVRRLGVREVEICFPETMEAMPAFSKEIAMAREEGIGLYSTWGPARIMVRGGRAAGVELRKCVSVHAGPGGFRAEYDEAVRREVRADSVILAVGQSADLRFLVDGALRPALSANAVRLKPSAVENAARGVFAAGDMVSGPGSVVEAMASGQRAAARIDLFLRGQDPALADRQTRCVLPGEPDYTGLDKRARVAPARPPLADRLAGFGLCEGGLSPEEARREGSRCMRCGIAVEYYRECWYCLPCEIECPTEALTLKIPFLVS